MHVIENYEHEVVEGEDILTKMHRISVIESAADELDMSLELHPDTEKELRAIGIEPEQFIERFQETEDGC